jgi:hypothetical protein
MSLAAPNETSYKQDVLQKWLEGAPVPVETVAVAKLISGLSPRTDHSRSEAHVRVLADIDEALPPLIVHRPTMRVIDGEHRLKAAIERGHATIAVRFFEGTIADAFALAVHANVTHGLALLTGERKAAAARLLESHPHWSDRMIARIAGLSHKTVGAIRRRSTGNVSQLYGSRVGIDGKVRTAEIAERRRTAQRLIEQNPQLSLRQLAAGANISVGTARDVRSRYLAGRGTASPRGSNDHGPEAPSLPAISLLKSFPGPVEDRGELLARLRRDPALRFTEKGREVLRRLSGALREVELLDRLLVDTPSHWRPTVAELARENAGNWAKIAEKLESIT